MRLKMITGLMAITAFVFLGFSGTAFADNVGIQTYAECVAQGGETSLVQLQTFPVQNQARCEIEGHVFVKGRREVSNNDDSSSSDSETTIRSQSDIRQRIEARRSELEEEREERRAALSARAQERIELFANGLFRSMDSAIERLRDIAERLESRIEKIEEDMDIDLSAQIEALVEAEGNIDSAELLSEEAKVNLEILVESETPREDFGVLRESIREAKSVLVEARQSLIEVLQSVRAEVEAETNAEVEIETE